jgi:hypothetical protein
VFILLLFSSWETHAAAQLISQFVHSKHIPLFGGSFSSSHLLLSKIMFISIFASLPW